MNTRDVLLKNWPVAGDDTSGLFEMALLFCVKTNACEKAIEKFCEKLSDELDEAFERGQMSINL